MLTKSNLSPPDPSKLKHMMQLVQSTADAGALFWTEENGFELKIPTPDQNQTLPMPLYILGLCFMRLSTDPNFASELMTWANRNRN